MVQNDYEGDIEYGDQVNHNEDNDWCDAKIIVIMLILALPKIVSTYS